MREASPTNASMYFIAGILGVLEVEKVALSPHLSKTCHDSLNPQSEYGVGGQKHGQCSAARMYAASWDRGTEDVHTADHGSNEGSFKSFAVVFNAGSTGQPKGVELSHRAVLSSIAYSIRHFSIRAWSRVGW